MRHAYKVLALLGITGSVTFTSAGCCCFCHPYRSSYNCAPPVSSCYQPPASSTASNDRLVPVPRAMPDCPPDTVTR